jgi:hypothetical protein
MEVWYAIPSASVERAASCATSWSAMGYKTAVLLDAASSPGVTSLPSVDLTLAVGEYVGWAKAVNDLCEILDADIVVTGGDDQSPDPHYTAAQIAGQFVEWFPDLFGVMQPTGDRFGSIDSVCASPWLGRGFIENAYETYGALHAGYFHYFADEELAVVAESVGALWRRPDLSHFHNHWQRRGEKRPEHLIGAGGKWGSDRALFTERRRNGFPGFKGRPA